MLREIFKSGTIGLVATGGGAGRANDGRPQPTRSPVRLAMRRALRPVVRVRRRHRAIAELSALSNRQLRDIGIERHRIAQVVDAHLREKESTS